MTKRKRSGPSSHDIWRIKANQVEAALVAAMPEQWRSKIGMLRAAVNSNDDVPVWMRDSETMAKLEQFRGDHGAARLWCMTDAEVCDMAREVAEKMQSWLGGGVLQSPFERVGKADIDVAWVDGSARTEADWHILPIAEKIYIVGRCCETLGVDPPAGMLACNADLQGGVIARAQCERWWRRALRKRVARVVEHGAIKLGIVNRLEGAYASDYAVTARKQQIARNAAMLDASIYRNEAGQVYRLSELAALSVANPDNRRNELMVRIRGAEEYADAAGHPGLFLTLTTPSRFHAVLSKERGDSKRLRVNPNYDPSQTPRDAQVWLREKWSRVRADMDRAGVQVYGVRVAEPHHDGTPHWHALLWFGSDAQANTARDSLLKHWLSDGGDEKGARKNRVNIKRMHKGGAAGYVAKYVAKNVGGSVNVQTHLDGDKAVNTGGVKGVERVDAWAARWGIRQFQTVGLPPVGVWRKLRGVDAGQIEAARTGGDWAAWKAWGAVHKVGDIAADFRRFIDAMGGVCQRRGEWVLRVAMRVEEGCKTEYGETVTRKTAVGVEVVRSGRWLVSKCVLWSRVALDVGSSDVEKAGGTPAPWTRFNNCTARLGGQLRAALLGLDRGGGYGDLVHAARC